jgi:hypothetical protein
MTLLVTQYGNSQPLPVSLRAFADAGHLDGFTIHAGDGLGVLKGTRLDEVTGLSLNGIAFAPGKLSTAKGGDELSMVAQDALAASALKPQDSTNAQITLKDGRVFNLAVFVEPPRPSVKLIGKSVQPSPSSSESNLQLADQNELPQDAKLVFSVRAQSPAAFTHDESIEVATADESFATTLSLGNGGITLQNSAVAVAALDPAKAFGSSAAGPLQFRVAAGAVTGDWQPLATLVRLPLLRDLKCPATAELACKLSGTNLFLIDSVSSTAQFDHPVQVPDGFPGSALPVPHPSGGQLYVRLRDDPSVISTATLGAQQLPPSAQEAALAPARHAAAHPEDSPANPSGNASIAPPAAPAPASPQQSPQP